MIDHPQQFTNSSHDSMAVSNTVYPKMDQNAWSIMKKMENPNREWMMTGGAPISGNPPCVSYSQQYIPPIGPLIEQARLPRVIMFAEDIPVRQL